MPREIKPLQREEREWRIEALVAEVRGHEAAGSRLEPEAAAVRRRLHEIGRDFGLVRG